MARTSTIPRWEQVRIADWQRSMIQSGVTERTRRARDGDLRTFAAWCEDQGIASVRNVDAEVCQAFVDSLGADGKAATTIKRFYYSIRHFLDFCGIKPNPALDVDLPSRDGTRMPRVSVDHSHADSVSGVNRDGVKRNQAIIRVIADTEASPVYLVEMSIDDVDLKKKRVFVCGRWHEIDPKTVSALRSYIRRRNQIVDETTSTTALWITTRPQGKGNPLQKTAMYQIAKIREVG